MGAWNVHNGVTFGNFHSWEDWGLYLKSRPSVAPPVPKTAFDDLIGADGSLDLTEALTGDVKYGPRDLHFEFTTIDAREGWFNTFSAVLNAIHGRRLRIVIDEDPEYYYEGRVTVNEFQSNKYTGTIVIDAVCDPYKYAITNTADDWLWDPFNFETGIIRPYASIDVLAAGTSVNVVGSRKKSVPTIKCSVPGMYVTFGSNTYELAEGNNKIYGIQLGEGVNVLNFYGADGNVEINYRPASL